MHGSVAHGSAMFSPLDRNIEAFHDDFDLNKNRGWNPNREDFRPASIQRAKYTASLEDIRKYAQGSWRSVATVGIAQGFAHDPLESVVDSNLTRARSHQTCQEFDGVGGPTSAVPDAILANWAELARSGLTETAYKTILRLASKKVNWNGQGSYSLSPTSLASFLIFWNLVSSSAEMPDLVLTPKGNLQAEWFASPSRFLEIDFRPKNEPSFVGLFDGKKAVIEGAASIKELSQLILNYRNGIALTWK
jgi:hypothetical protein